MSSGESTTAGTLTSLWALAGVGALFAFAVLRMGLRGLATVRAGLDPWEWTVLALTTAAFVYGEGVRALQRRWVPSLIERARLLGHASSLTSRGLAPVYALGLLGGTARSRLRAWLSSTLIVGAVLLVRALPDPWRGIIDVAVAAALAWGLLAIIRTARSALNGK